MKCLLIGALLAIASLLSLISPGGKPAASQRDDGLSPQQVAAAERLKTEIAAHLDDPRATYTIIWKAYKHGLAMQATACYRDWSHRRPRDPVVNAAFAFGYSLAGEYYWGDYITEQQRYSRLSQEEGRWEFEAGEAAAEADAAAPRRPEILVETVPIRFFNIAGLDQRLLISRRRALDRARLAVQLAPNWAPARFWLGAALNVYGNTINSKDCFREAIQSLGAAERLDSSLHVVCLFEEAEAYACLDDYAAGSRLLDEWIKEYPTLAYTKRRNLVGPKGLQGQLHRLLGKQQ